MAEIIPDPECKGFNGIYAGGPDEILPPSRYNMAGMVQYMRQNNKVYSELTEEEKKEFLF